MAAVGEIKQENEPPPTDNGKFYDDAKEYWSGIPPTIDGMLGGFGKVSPTDINGSKAFLRQFLRVGGGKVNNSCALDCGSGIGRITKRLLLPIFKSVDMVELNKAFLDEARNFIGEDSKRVDKLICSGLQEFTPDSKRYDVIWCQWVLGHLTDDDLVSFFQRCRRGLSADGIIVVKENMNTGKDMDFDDTDSSYTRPKELLTTLFDKAGLKILKEQRQKGFPKEIYDVYMFAMQ